MLLNPYKPGAGKPPSYLAGRESIIEQALRESCFLQEGTAGRPIAYYGLRGVGKTVMLNAIKKRVEDSGILCEFIEISERDNFKQVIALSVKKLMRKLSLVETVKTHITNALGVLKAFSITWSPDGNEFGFGVGDDVAAASGTADTGHFQSDLTELFLALGELAQCKERGVCLFFDEIQYLGDVELEALIAAIHRANQVDSPIMVYVTGLPMILKQMGDIKSYAERLFEFVSIGPLSESDAIDALAKPALKREVTFTNEAVSRIVNITAGYPYFIQEFGRQVWEIRKSETIDIDDVSKAVTLFHKSLDSGFFKVRLDRATPREKEFMYGMVECGELPCTLANVADNMKSSTKKIAPLRAQLIRKGFIFSTGHGEIDFTVPQFDLYLKRLA